MKRLFALLVFLAIAIPVLAEWQFNPYTGKLDYYQPSVYSAVTISAAYGATPTQANIKAQNATIITNYGQLASNVTTTLPATAANLGFMVVIGTAQASNYFRVTSAAGGDIYLDGSATGKNYVQLSAPVVGNYFSCFTFQTATSTWSWLCASGVGATSTN